MGFIRGTGMGRDTPPEAFAPCRGSPAHSCSRPIPTAFAMGHILSAQGAWTPRAMNSGDGPATPVGGRFVWHRQEWRERRDYMHLKPVRKVRMESKKAEGKRVAAALRRHERRESVGVMAR